jgi:hypothetical protein
METTTHTPDWPFRPWRVGDPYPTHTPGPWTVGDPDEYGDGVTIDSPEGPLAFRVIDCSADLIATAPELLAFVLKVARHYEGTESGDEAARLVSKVDSTAT